MQRRSGLVEMTCAVLVLSFSAFAQTFPGTAPIWMPDYSGMVQAQGDQLMSRMAAENLNGGRGWSDEDVNPAKLTLSPALALTTAAPPRNASSLRFSYIPTPKIADEVRRGVIARTAKVDRSAAQQVAEQLSQHDSFRIYSGIVSPLGLRRGDVADSMTAYTLLAWMIANGTVDPSRSEVTAVRSRVAGELSRIAAVQSAANRQRMDEELMYLFVIMHAGWQSAQREGKLDQYSDGVAQAFRKQFGRDLRRLELTEDGFVERG